MRPERSAAIANILTVGGENAGHFPGVRVELPGSCTLIILAVAVNLICGNIEEIQNKNVLVQFLDALRSDTAKVLAETCLALFYEADNTVKFAPAKP